MKTVEFPTIKQMEDAICFFCDARNIQYDAEMHTFFYVELVPYPIKDDGGPIDCIGYHEIPYTMSFTDAYKHWRDVQEFIKEEFPPEPVAPYTRSEYEDLPF